MSGSGQALLGNSMIKKQVREEEVTLSMDGQEHVHYSSPQKYIRNISFPTLTLPDYSLT